MKLNPLTQLMAVVACFATCTAASAQEAVTLQEDGSLKGKAFVSATDEAVDAKITLTQDGKVVSTVATDEKGNFSFANVEPGVYNMQGIADPYVGSAEVSVAPFSGGCQSCNLGLSTPSPEVAYDTCGAAPVQACSTCNTCGGGGGGLLGGGGGGIGGGGLLGGGGGLIGSRPLLGLGVVGGIVAIAVSDDDDDDVSPSN